MNQLGKKILVGTAWSLAGNIGYISVSLISNIVLARILGPVEFGRIGVIMFFISISNILIEGGLGGALVRKKETKKEDYSTVFVCNLLLSIFLYLILILLSSKIAYLYNDSKLKNLLITSGIVLIINSFQITQNAKLVHDLNFKKLSIYRFISIFLASIISIYLAQNGFGVWSLVIHQICTSLFITLSFVFLEGFFFSMKFNKESFLDLYKFGVNTTISSIINTAFDNVYQLILGHNFSIKQVGFYYQAKKLQDAPNNLINAILQGSLFSSLSKYQDQKDSFKNIYDKTSKYLMILMGLTSTFTYIYAEDIIILLYGNSWLNSVFFLRILCLAAFFYVLESLNRIIFKIYNETNKILKLEIVKKLIQSLTIIIGVLKSDLGLLLYGFLATSILSYIINIYHSKKIIKHDAKSNIIFILKIFICSLTCIFIISLIHVKGQSIYNLMLSPIAILINIILLHLIGVVNLKAELVLIKKGIKKQ